MMPDPTKPSRPLKALLGGQYQPLRQDQIGRIHQTALRILEEIGVRVQSEEARRILLNGGATVTPTSPGTAPALDGPVGLATAPRRSGHGGAPPPADRSRCRRGCG